MDIMRIIKTRRSVRKFKKGKISEDLIKNILESARFAPSGLNNQPWKFLVLEDNRKNDLAQFTHYSSIIKGADKLILVFLNKDSSYNRDKDLMAIGASIENMLLYIHAHNLGACWLGEIINKKEAIHRFLNTPSYLELMAVVAVGVPSYIPKRTKRKPLSKIILT